MNFFNASEDTVKYACTCGSLKSIAKIYFCRHCLKIRCGYCVSHEVDLHYCGNCLENLPSTEARLKKNRCGYCFNCPSCQNILNIRAVSSSAPHPDDPSKTVSKKSYYLACGFCRWTSRDVSIPDQSTASGGWPERECPQAKRVAELVEHYQELALLEKLEEGEKKKKYQSRPSYFHYAEKFGLGAAVARKRLSTPPREPRQPQTRVEPAKAVEDVAQLPSDIFTSPVDLTSVTTLRQRFAAPDIQPWVVTDLYPVHKPLMAKRSFRCRECEHNVSKPEFNPSSTKFKIQLSAFYHIPEVRFVTCEPIYPGQASELIITVCNPTQHLTSVQFLPISTEEVQEETVTESQDAPSESQTEGNVSSPHSDESTCLIQPLKMPISLQLKEFQENGMVHLPDVEIQLLPRDDAAEFDDSSKVPNFVDDPKIVAWRKGNKVALKMRVTPQEGAEGQLGVAFVLKYSYINTMTMLEKKEPQKMLLNCKVFLKAGPIYNKIE